MCLHLYTIFNVLLHSLKPQKLQPEFSAKSNFEDIRKVIFLKIAVTFAIFPVIADNSVNSTPGCKAGRGSLMQNARPDIHR